jgi:Mrp family chromosome partitioning ATPase
MQLMQHTRAHRLSTTATTASTPTTASTRLLTAREIADLEAQVISLLRESVIEPVSGRNLISVGAVQHARVTQEGGVHITLDLLANKHPDEAAILKDCRAALAQLSASPPGFLPLSPLPPPLTLHIDVLNRMPRSAFAKRDSALSKVQHVVAVSSCKGGVGKSTVAVNLALSLAAKGLRVGLLDADIYGPSLPYMLIPDSYDVRRSAVNEKWVLPLTAHGVKCMSFGFVNPSAGPGAGGVSAAVMRGPMASKVCNL